MASNPKTTRTTDIVRRELGNVIFYEAQRENSRVENLCKRSKFKSPPGDKMLRDLRYERRAYVRFYPGFYEVRTSFHFIKGGRTDVCNEGGREGQRLGRKTVGGRKAGREVKRTRTGVDGWKEGWMLECMNGLLDG